MSTYAGRLFQLNKSQGSSGDTITVSIIKSSSATFKVTSNHRAFFEPIPPQAGTTFFGYEAQFSRIDDKTAQVVVPPIGPNQPFEMPAGKYRFIIVTGRDFADSEDIFTAIKPANTSVSGGALSPYSPVGQPPILSSIGNIKKMLTNPPSFFPTKTLIGQTIQLPTSKTKITPIKNPGTQPRVPSGLIKDFKETINVSDLKYKKNPALPSEESEQETIQETVRWVVVVTSPVREGPGPDLRPMDYQSEPIPVEREKGSMPVQQFDFIVRADLTLQAEIPIANRKVSWSFDDRLAVPNDDSRIIEVSNDLDALRTKLEANQVDAGPDYAYTGDEGEVYCWMRIRLYDESELSNEDLYVKPFRITLGEDTEPVEEFEPIKKEVLLASTPRLPIKNDFLLSQPLEVVNFDLEDFFDFPDVLVDPFQPAITTAVRKVGGFLLASSAGITRTKQQAIGFFLKRIADEVIREFDLETTIAVQFTSFLNDQKNNDKLQAFDQETLRALVIGMMLGIPRGNWVMAKDQVEDLKAIAIDLPRALINFIEQNPMKAMIIAGDIALNGVIYTANVSLLKAIKKAFLRIYDKKDELVKLIAKLYLEVSLLSNLEILIALAKGQQIAAGVVKTLGEAFYTGFEKFVGYIPTDYLNYPKNSNPYHYFIGAFIAGDFLGYIVGTVGVEVLLAVLTDGIATYLKVVAKLGRLGKVGIKALKAIEDLVDTFNRLSKVLSKLVDAAQGKLKDRVVKTILYAVRFIDELKPRFIKSFIEALTEGAEEVRDRVLKWVYRYGKDGDGVGMRGVAEALDGEFPIDQPEQAKEVIELLAYTAEPKKDRPGFIPSCK
ncbi:ABC-type proline/glycine betaine transport system permease subunit [Catalinimonas alkaloidigena]|uniref:hypothetical protein n=1 Tax=Catalinimonas alkaloidigena TaxID=1075417 RepID=UPI002406B747|nr:hypothetical protein [Catalinimonas alkaloidigena]MDF9800163.1 ABC-type proline/glycine betaine transport system permease subunit [Catalinimonas alkaloidigena]